MPSGYSLFGSGVLALTIGLMTFTPVEAQIFPLSSSTWHSGTSASDDTGLRKIQYRYYRNRGYYNNNAAGAAIAGGILGLAAGAAIAGSAANAAPPPGYYGAPPAPDPNWIAYCARKYRSFDPSSGTYLSYDGNRYLCQ
ncbi:BA14K family protein [Beijerinckia mobilis]|uniref:BA14K family protein n=1 Tax=Beijerinckia mobilis TaxID=231434 RepID=UPI00273A8BB7|nr:BA14K family protein [Beijerinckia mobilis]